MDSTVQSSSGVHTTVSELSNKHKTSNVSALSPSIIEKFPSELVPHIAEFLTNSEGKILTHFYPNLLELVERQTWRHYLVRIPPEQHQDGSTSKKASEAEIYEGWRRFQEELEYCPKRAEYICSISFAANTKSIPIAAHILPKLVSLRSIINRNPYIAGRSQDDDKAFLTILDNYGARPHINTLDLSITQTGSHDRFRILQNFPNLVHLQTGISASAAENTEPGPPPLLQQLESLSIEAHLLPTQGIHFLRTAPKLSKLVTNNRLDIGHNNDTKDSAALSETLALRETLSSTRIKSLDVICHSWNALTEFAERGLSPVSELRFLPKLEILTVAGTVGPFANVLRQVSLTCSSILTAYPDIQSCNCST